MIPGKYITVDSVQISWDNLLEAISNGVEYVPIGEVSLTDIEMLIDSAQVLVERFAESGTAVEDQTRLADDKCRLGFRKMIIHVLSRSVKDTFITDGKSYRDALKNLDNLECVVKEFKDIINRYELGRSEDND